MSDSFPVPHGAVIVTENPAGGFTQTVHTETHDFLADEPVSAGGRDLGPDPYRLLLAALGACTSMTIRMYADRKQWPVDRIEVRLRHDRIHATDCADCLDKNAMVDKITRDIVIEGDLDDEQRRRLMEIADRCPVHRTLTGTIRVASALVED
jgi:putative redox protein